MCIRDSPVCVCLVFHSDFRYVISFDYQQSGEVKTLLCNLANTADSHRMWERQQRMDPESNKAQHSRAQQAIISVWILKVLLGFSYVIRDVMWGYFISQDDLIIIS